MGSAEIIPQANDDGVNAVEDTALRINATNNDTNVVAAYLPVIVQGASNGSLQMNADGSFSYTRNANYHGSDSFTYRLSNGVGQSNVATISITVASVNDAPVVNTNTAAVTLNEEGTATINLAALVSDIDGDSLSFEITVSFLSHLANRTRFVILCLGATLTVVIFDKLRAIFRSTVVIYRCFRTVLHGYCV